VGTPKRRIPFAVVDNVPGQDAPDKIGPVPMHHVHRGSGPPLLLVHGLGMSHRAWRDVVPLLEDDFECFAVDLPGFGASPQLDVPPTMAALGGACAALMASLGHDAFHVAGNSLGGGIALWLALEGRARSACALSPVGFAADWERAWMHVSLVATRASEPVVRPALPVLGRPPWVRRALFSELVAHGERRSVQDAVEAYEDLGAAAGFTATLRHAVNWRCPSVTGALPCPVTVAWGEHDRLLLHRPQSARARERLPQAEHLLLEDCGHLPTWDDPAQVTRVLRVTAARGGGVRRAGPSPA
jgi:pimeloyl-ACP methyl ester carboxylesterase